MRAIVQDVYGEAKDVLRVAEIDRPTIRDDEVLVRVHAAGVDRGTWHIMAGLPYPLRLFGYGLRAPADRVRGREVAGRVEKVGRAVTTLQVGDAVFGIAEGSFAEYAPARGDKLARKPANLTFEQAAAVTISALTALQGIRDRGRVQAGQRVLVIGASGGVGTFAVQSAKERRASLRRHTQLGTGPTRRNRGRLLKGAGRPSPWASQGVPVGTAHQANGAAAVWAAQNSRTRRTVSVGASRGVR
jgi:NADPH:quinone reductase-like Zn-dependent oxidoreductase